MSVRSGSGSGTPIRSLMAAAAPSSRAGLLGVTGCGGHPGQALDAARNREGRAMLPGRRQRLPVAALGLGQLARQLLAPSKAAQRLGQASQPSHPGAPTGLPEDRHGLLVALGGQVQVATLPGQHALPLWARAAPTR
jgi:hypothetical protein